MTQNCHMASTDLKDAYYSVPIAKSHQKYLKFEWNNMLFQFTCFPNRLACCPRKFTELMKLVYTTLRQLGHLPSDYVDDSCLTGPDKKDCVLNLVDTVKSLDSLGFVHAFLKVQLSRLCCRKSCRLPYSRCQPCRTTRTGNDHSRRGSR